MPSDVYLRTRDALATLVSERAATRVLDAALRSLSVSASTLDESMVRKLLLGPVQRELEGILPRTGLRRTLRRLARQVGDAAPRGRSGPVTAPEPKASDAPPAPLHPVTRSSVYLPDVEIQAQDAWDGARDGLRWTDDAPGAEPALAAVAVAEAAGSRTAVGELRPVERQRASGSAVSSRTDGPKPTVVPKALPPEALDALAVQFAEIEGVTQVIALRDRSDPPQVRGEGIDAEALAPLARSAIRLLGRHGPLRSLVLEHEAGLLFVFPLGRDAVAVLAASNINMGAVFAARAALEEGQ